MKNYRNLNGEIFSFDLDCFDKNRKCINEYALKVIEENNLVAMTEEEYAEIQAKKEAERLAEEEKLTIEQKEINKANKLIEFYELAIELGLM